jgi:hypothetical protein
MGTGCSATEFKRDATIRGGCGGAGVKDRCRLNERLRGRQRGSRTGAEGRSRPRTRARSPIAPRMTEDRNPSVCSQPTGMASHQDPTRGLPSRRRERRSSPSLPLSSCGNQWTLVSRLVSTSKLTLPGTDFFRRGAGVVSDFGRRLSGDGPVWTRRFFAFVSPWWLPPWFGERGNRWWG